jgi:hypothetical protein
MANGCHACFWHAIGIGHIERHAREASGRKFNLWQNLIMHQVLAALSIALHRDADA